MGLLTAESLGVNNHIAYCCYLKSPSSTQLRRWTSFELESYVFYLEAGKRKDTLFGGILFEADVSLDGFSISPRTIGMGKPSKLHAWEQALEELYAPGAQLDALFAITQTMPVEQSVDVWVALPYPMLRAKEDFGSIQGRALNFSASTEDRAEALRWWIDQVLERFQAAEKIYPVHRLRLQGFVWTRGYLDAGDRELIQTCSSYLKQRNHKLLWVQNYGTTDAIKGYEWGFDGIFTRPTYMQSEPRDTPWIRYSVKLSANYNFGMVHWADQRLSSTQVKDFLEEGSVHFQNAFQIYDIFSGSVPGPLTAHPFYSDLYAYIQGTFSADPKGEE